MGKIVMVIDDDEDVREVLRDFIEDIGYRPVVAANGQEGLDAIRRLDERPCVILLDLMMPVMDGWRFLEVVACDADLASIPVVISTSAPDRAPRGPRILAKPVDLEDFMAELRHHCSGAPAGA
ncbi:MAG TPA: response regulator [Kofleriaceae bacterium]|nr:response regulator [Kofleriaceae bacterium]